MRSVHIVAHHKPSVLSISHPHASHSEARDHGLQRVGLPSRFVSFNANTRTAGQHEITPSWWDGDITASPATNTRSDAVAVRIEDNSKRWFWRRGAAAKHPVVAFTLPDVLKGWKGPRIPLALPSYSGNTDAYPGLLHYACQLHTNVQFVKPLRVRVDGMGEDEDESMRGVFGGRALLTMAFEDMEVCAPWVCKWLLGGVILQFNTHPPIRCVWRSLWCGFHPRDSKRAISQRWPTSFSLVLHFISTTFVNTFCIACIAQ